MSGHNPNGTLCPFEGGKCRRCGRGEECLTYQGVKEFITKHGNQQQVSYLFDANPELEESVITTNQTNKHRCDIVPIGINSREKELAISA